MRGRHMSDSRHHRQWLRSIPTTNSVRHSSCFIRPSCQDAAGFLMVLMHGWGYALTWNVCTLVIKNPYSGIYFSRHPLHSILVCQERMWVTPMLSSRVLCLELLHWWCSTPCSGCPWTTRRQSVRLSPQIDNALGTVVIKGHPVTQGIELAAT